MDDMSPWSLPLGRWFGTEVRLHASLLLLLGIFISLATYRGETGGRGLALWLLLLAALAVRELARMAAAAWCGLEIESLLLLPTGALLSYRGREGQTAAERTPQAMNFAGPAANLLFGLVLGSLILSVSPGVPILSRPWITTSALLRSAVWLNLLLAAANLLPVPPLDGSRAFGSGGGGALLRSARGGFGLGTLVSCALIALGVALGGVAWMILLGVFLLLGAQIGGGAGRLVETGANTIRMRDVMLMDFATLSASDTLEDALDRSLHSLQDVFPVVRGGSMVGAVSRQNIVEALMNHGNSYVQGVMTRSFQTASPEDSVLSTLRRLVGGTGVQIVPVTEGDRIIGIITPQNLSQSMRMLHQRRRLRSAELSRGE